MFSIFFYLDELTCNVEILKNCSAFQPSILMNKLRKEVACKAGFNALLTN